MNVIEEAKKLIKVHEGLRLEPYKCTAGKLTLGYGRNLEAVGLSTAEYKIIGDVTKGITEEQAEMLLDNDIKAVVKRLNESFPGFNKLPDYVQVVLIDMTFNLGYFGLMKFIDTLAYIEKKDYKSAAKEMLKSKWARQVGKRSKELAKIMETGKIE